MNSPNKDVTIDQVLSLLVPYVSNNLDFCKDIQQNSQKLPECVAKIVYIFQTFYFV